jgi:hypothetical protein
MIKLLEDVLADLISILKTARNPAAKKLWHCEYSKFGMFLLRLANSKALLVSASPSKR